MCRMKAACWSFVASGRALCLVLCAVSLLTGCPRSDKPPEPNPPDGPEVCEATDDSCIALGDWCQVFATEECRRRASCGMLEEAKVPACVQRLVTLCPQAAIEHSVNSGRATYWGTRARECVTRFQEMVGCGEGFTGYYRYYEDLFQEALAPGPSSLEVCKTVFEGTSKPTEACGQVIDCAPGSYCKRDTCPGRCVAYRQLGEACDHDTPCVPEAQCYFSSAQGTCIARAEPGETCSCPLHRLDSQCGCRLELICNAPPLSGSGACVSPRAAIGEGCGGYGPHCAPNGFCAGGTCVPLRKQGESCSSDGECEGGLNCKAGACVGLAGEGGECQSSMDCKSELFCEASRCRAFPGEGQPCASQYPFCDAQHACDGPSGLCARLTGAGEPCVCAYRNSTTYCFCSTGQCDFSQICQAPCLP
jgi:hypothetical protein